MLLLAQLSFCLILPTGKMFIIPLLIGVTADLDCCGCLLLDWTQSKHKPKYRNNQNKLLLNRICKWRFLQAEGWGWKVKAPKAFWLFRRKTASTFLLIHTGTLSAPPHLQKWMDAPSLLLFCWKSCARQLSSLQVPARVYLAKKRRLLRASEGRFRGWFCTGELIYNIKTFLFKTDKSEAMHQIMFQGISASPLRWIQNSPKNGFPKELTSWLLCHMDF